ncbi:MAG TPA: ParB N-terminal domain-containing protein [Firmicutes bacterium]|nr:ParB N-terminal domain-containing protein [Bacillota bacterium]
MKLNTLFLGGKVDRVRSFDREKSKYKALNQHYAGVKPIEVDKIVGSVDRWEELDSNFQWKGRRPDERTKRIEAALARGEILPPIEVYELDGKYFVVDGHHRVGAAKKLGQAYLDADITQFSPAQGYSAPNSL